MPRLPALEPQRRRLGVNIVDTDDEEPQIQRNIRRIPNTSARSNNRRRPSNVTIIQEDGELNIDISDVISGSVRIGSVRISTTSTAIRQGNTARLSSSNFESDAATSESSASRSAESSASLTVYGNTVYKYLNDADVRTICRDRDIDVPKGVDIREYLQSFDEIFPEYLDSIKKKAIAQLSYDETLIRLAILNVKPLGTTSEIISKVLIYLNVLSDDFDVNTKLEMLKVIELPIAEKRNILRSRYPNVIDGVFTANELDRILIDGLNKLPDFYEHRVSRYNKIRNSDKLKKFYHIGRDPEALSLVVSGVVHSLESLVEQLTPENCLSMVNGVMVIPFTESPYDYIMKNISNYSCVYARNTRRPFVTKIEEFKKLDDTARRFELERFTDNEIFAIVDGFVSYKSRDNLISRVSHLFISKSFFVPITRARSINKETVMATEISDMNTFMVGYGTFSSYYLYELDDLISAFNLEGAGFSRPENPREKFTTSDIDELKKLLLMYPPNDKIKELNNIFSKKQLAEHEKLRNDASLVKRFETLKNPQSLRSFLYALFDAGMYMRKWRGPGHPYPIYEAQTKTLGYDPNDKVTESLIHCHQQLVDNSQERKFAWDLPVCFYERATVMNKNVSLGQLLEIVGSGGYCIRMASSLLTSSSYRYLLLFFGERIPNVDMNWIEAVS